MLKGIMFIFCIILLSTNVYAIGISPGKVSYDFIPGLSDNITFQIFNIGNEPLLAVVSIRGDLAEYFDFKETNLTLEPNQTVMLSASFFLPETADIKPGTRRTDIVATEVSESDSQVGAVAAVGLLVFVKVPYEGQYLDAKIHASDVEVGEDVNFLVTLESLGLETVEMVDGKITVMDKNNFSLGILSFIEEDILPDESREITLTWNSGNNPAGIYMGDLVIDYVGKIRETNTKFRIGDLDIAILDLQGKELPKNQISQLKILTQSFWNYDIEEVYAEIDIEGRKSKSETFDYGAWGQKNITIYFDTKGMDSGSYDAVVTLFYQNKTNEKIFNVKIGSGGIESYLIYGLIVVVLILLVFIVLKKSKLFKLRKRKE